MYLSQLLQFSRAKRVETGGNGENSWEQIGNILGNETLSKTKNTSSLEMIYEGSSGRSRRSQVKAVISSVITEILDNGNLYLEGIHKVKVNDELETIRVAGVVRPQDISAKNSVFFIRLLKLKFQ